MKEKENRNIEEEKDMILTKLIMIAMSQMET